MLETLKKALKVKEIRKRLLYTFVMLIVVRLGCQIAIPFVNADMVAEVTSPFKEGGFSFLSAITGGSLENMSIFALNITPYITASIIMQLLTIAIPKLDELQKDGEEGRKKIAEITRYLTVALALIESTAMIIGFANQGIFNTDSISYGSMSSLRKWGVVLTGIIAMTAGSAVLMWIGEQITEKGVGNGISIVLTINIISGMPSDISNLFTTFVTGEGKSIGMRILSALIIIGVIVGIVVLVVILQAATRNIAVQMSQKLQFPVVIASFFGKQPEWANYLTQSHWCKPSQLKYSIGFVVYLLLVLFFAYFYTSITFNPREVAKNLNDRGGFIPGIRSGKPTVEYLTKILNYIIFIGAVGLIIVAVIPILASGLTGANVGFGGTSIIIIVGVILETLQTIKSMITERSYSTVKGIF